MAFPIALQLYTVRDAIKADLESTLKEVARIGYRFVETAGMAGQTPAEMKKLLDSLKLTAVSGHGGIESFADNLDPMLADARVLGYQFLGCAVLAEAHRSVEGFTKAGNILAAAHKKAQPRGVSVFYHNHSFEYAKLADGRTGMDILTGHPGVNFELDIFWVQHGGDDPVRRMKSLASRVPLLHVKDMASGPERRFTEVGTGIVDIKAAVAAAPAYGVKCLIIEQDRHWIDDNPLKSAAISYENLRKIVG